MTWPEVNEAVAANWTCVGICAHESAMAGGKRVDLPVVREPARTTSFFDAPAMGISDRGID